LFTALRAAIKSFLYRVGCFDDEQRLSALDDVARFRQKLDHAARIGREDGRRTIFVDRDLALGDVFAAKCLLGHRLDGKSGPLRRARHISGKPRSLLA
jgi:hypothetical protein